MPSENSIKDYVSAWMSGEAPVPPVVALLGIRLTRSDNGQGSAEMDVDARHHNAMGGVHGGIFCDLADVALGGAVVSCLKAGETFATISLSVDFLHGVSEGRLTADARIVKQGRSVVFAECTVSDAQGRRVAQVHSSSLIRELGKSLS